MSITEIETTIIETLDEMDVYIDASNTSITTDDVGPTDIDLRDYIVDSIMFITLIVELEKKFNIDFPDELLWIESLSSLSGFSYLLMETINNNREENYYEKDLKKTEA